MNYLSVAQIAQKWKISERSVRNYCAAGRVPGAFLTGKTWNVPEGAQKPARRGSDSDAPRALLTALRDEMRSRQSGGIYHRVQVDLTYNSNHIEGSRLSREQTRHIFETNTLGIAEDGVNVDDIVETANHFRCIDMVLEAANARLSERLIKRLHAQLKGSTSDSRKDWFAVGAYKRFPNEVGGRETTPPEDVPSRMCELIAAYESTPEKVLEDLIDFHVRFERIHPFQDGNGRVGRLILFKECLRWNVVPFIIEDDLKLYYYRGLAEWDRERGYLRDTCLTAQDRFKQRLDYFRIRY